MIEAEITTSDHLRGGLGGVPLVGYAHHGRPKTVGYCPVASLASHGQGFAMIDL